MGSSVNSKLWKAIDKGDIDLARRAIDDGANVNQRDKDNRTPLIKSIINGHLDVVTVLIDRGADISVDDGLGAYPLHLAIEGGRIDIAKVLIDRGADINIMVKGIGSPLQLAIEGGHFALVLELLDRGANINVQGERGVSLLHLAIEGGHIDIARVMIDRGANINIKNGWGDSPLHWAINGCHIDMARMLINRGADINIKNSRGDSGDSPLHWALRGGHIVSAMELIDSGADINLKDRGGNIPLLWAIREGDTDMARMLIDGGADINAEDWSCSSSLHSAIEGKHFNVALMLIERGADINCRNKRGDSPLHLMITGGYIDMAGELIDRGADISIKDRSGDSTLHLATAEGNIDMVRMLIKRGADINIKDGCGDYPLHLAIKGGHIDIAGELIDRGADINTNDGWGACPLHLAIMGVHIELAGKLIDGSADININDRCGVRPLHLAIKGGHIELAGKLIDRGADINDWTGGCSLHCAIKVGHTEMVKMLLDRRCADVNVKDWQGDHPLHMAIKRVYTDVARVLICEGVDINTRDSLGDSPLHLAIKGGHIEIAMTLIDRGADPSDLFLSLIEGYIERLKVLDVIDPCSISRLCSQGLLHKPVRLGYHDITRFLLSCNGIIVNITDSLGYTPLDCAIEIGNEDIVNELLAAGHKFGALDYSGRNVLHLSAIYGHHALMKSFIKRGLDPHKVDFQGRTCLHYGVIYRQDDIVSLLLRLRAKCHVKDHDGKTPIDYLHPCERNSTIFRELTQNPLGTKVLPLKKIKSSQEIPCSCYDLAELGKQPGIGSVNNIEEFVMVDFIGLVKRMVEKVIHDALPSSADVKVVGCGSSFEGSKVGMPDELDFLIEICSIHRNPGSETEGYGKVELDEDSIKQLDIQGTYGVWLWDKLMTYWTKNPFEDIGCGLRLALPPQRHPDRKTCTTWIWLYSNAMFNDQPVSIDFVPAIKTDCLAEERTTWMMTKDEIRKKHRYIVPKIPYENSDVSKSFKPEDLNQLGRISYPTLEVEHMQSLDTRLMDVFITVKSLRRPEVCGFKIRNENGKAIAVGEHITSYRLKTVFLHLVELFLKSVTLSHGKMVLMVYELLENCLERERLPSFFDPTVDVLAGCRLDIKDSYIVAKLMTRLVRSMYERDFQSEVAEDLEEEKRILRVSRVEYDEREKEYKKDEYGYDRQYGALHLPIYL